MLKYDFENSVAYWVVTTAHAFERALNEALAPHGITYRQWQVLGWLALEGDLCQADLADRMRIEPATLVRVLDRMEQAGWVRRRPCTRDRRRNLICPTRKAEPVWLKVVQCARRIREKAVAGLSEAELNRLKHILYAVRENVEAADAARASNRS